jgi:small subunit ribosomal protein S1
MDGLIHISELSWSHVNHPSEVLEIGQDVEVKVLDIDRDRQRISLGLKQTQSDPWQQVVEAYDENDVVQGKVTKVVTFGAFVEIMPGVEGLVHISELAQHHVENPREVVSQGDVVNVKIIEVDADRRRLSLSLKRVDEGDDVQPRADGQPLETPAPPQIDLSDEVFADESQGADAEGPSDTVLQGEEEPVAEVAPAADEPEAPAEEPVAEVGPAADEPEAPAGDDAEASIEADAVDPTHQGPGDSEGHAPYAPEEAEGKQD